MSTELRDDDREAILGSLDKDVEEEEENEGEERDGDEMGLVESAEMEGKVVEEAIGGGLKTGGARSGGGGGVEERPFGDYRERGGVAWGEMWGSEEEEEEDGEGSREMGSGYIRVEPDFSSILFCSLSSSPTSPLLYHQICENGRSETSTCEPVASVCSSASSVGNPIPPNNH